MAQYSVQDFLQQTGERDLGHGLFELERDRLLEVNLNNNTIWTKMGSMVAYTGQVKFEREGVLEQGLGNLLKKAVSGEGARLTKAIGTGKVYLADSGKKVSVIRLENSALVVNGNDILAFEMGLQYKITMMRKVAAMVSGGLFQVRLEGTGLIAITSHFDPLTLRVQPGRPVITDPNATIAWSGNLQPELKTDVSFRTFIGRGSGESIQMLFNGDGFVVVQPYEEVYFQHGS